MRTPTAPDHLRGQRPLLLAGLAAPVVLVAGVVIAGFTWPSYRHRTQNISDLGGTTAPAAIVQNATFVLFGVLVVAFAVGLRRSHLGRSATSGPLLVGAFGFMAVIQGFTPCTPGCAEATLMDLVHVLAAVTGFLVVTAAMLLLWRAERTADVPATQRAYSAWIGVGALGLLIAWFAAGAVDPDRWHAGVHQRLLVAAILIWLGVTAARLLRSTDA
jgi:hypothetical membrane protein